MTNSIQLIYIIINKKQLKYQNKQSLKTTIQNQTIVNQTIKSKLQNKKTALIVRFLIYKFNNDFIKNNSGLPV
jgi:hypothetical protein